MSIYQIRKVEPPAKGVLHWFGQGVGYQHAYCGTFGYAQFHTDDREQVTCAKCDRKLKSDTE
jgi:hypothetical protein